MGQLPIGKVIVSLQIWPPSEQTFLERDFALSLQAVKMTSCSQLNPVSIIFFFVIVYK